MGTGAPTTLKILLIIFFSFKDSYILWLENLKKENELSFFTELWEKTARVGDTGSVEG